MVILIIRKIMIRTKVILLIMLGIFLTSCQGRIEKNKGFDIVDMHNIKAKKVEDIYWKEHKTFDNIEQSDTLRLSPNLISVLKAEYLIKSNSDYTSDIIYSSASVIFNKSCFYKRDSILSIGPFCINHKENNIGFSVILSQNQDSATTISDLILLNNNNCQSTVIKKSIQNNANPFFSFDDKRLFYVEGNSLFCYNLEDKKDNKIIELESFQGLILYIEPVTSTTFKIFYLKNIESGDVFESLISSSKPYFK